MLYVIKSFYLLLFLFLLFLPEASFAHVRWFAPEGLKPIELPMDSISYTLMAVVACVVLFALVLSRLSRSYVLLEHLLVKELPFPYRGTWYVLLVLINLFMVINLLYGEFLAPNLLLPLDALFVGVIIQAAVLVVMPWSVALVGFLLILVGFSLFCIASVSVTLDYLFEFVGVGIALILVGGALNKNDHRLCEYFNWSTEKLRSYAVVVLRTFLGLQLSELAIQNKLLNPASALWFIDNNDFYNFFSGLGFESVTNLHFVLFVGLSELVMGVMLILNIVPRAVLAMLCLAFVTTSIFSGGHELVGHIPLVGVFIVLIVEPCPTRIKRYSA